MYVVGIAAKIKLVETVGHEVMQFVFKGNLDIFVRHSNSTFSKSSGLYRSLSSQCCCAGFTMYLVGQLQQCLHTPLGCLLLDPQALHQRSDMPEPSPATSLWRDILQQQPEWVYRLLDHMYYNDMNHVAEQMHASTQCYLLSQMDWTNLDG